MATDGRAVSYVAADLDSLKIVRSAALEIRGRLATVIFCRCTAS
jgi:hypothetical protein